MSQSKKSFSKNIYKIFKKNTNGNKMKPIEIAYDNFWDDFNPLTCLITKLLQSRYDVRIIPLSQVTSKTDLCIIGCHTLFFDRLPCKTLYFTGENDFPDFNKYDYAIGHATLSYNRYFRCPLWIFNNSDKIKTSLSVRGSLSDELYNRKFCSFVVSNNTCALPQRTTLFNKINEYSHVDSAGAYLNNVGGKTVDDKILYISRYRFNIASENSIVNGYVTEKIFDAFSANTIPIYLGAPDVNIDFNEDSFINVGRYTSYSEVLKRIHEINSNKDLYLEMLNTPFIADPNYVDDLLCNMTDFLKNIIEYGKIYNHKYGRIGLVNLHYEKIVNPTLLGQ